MKKTDTFYDVEKELYRSHFSKAIQMLESMAPDAKNSYEFHFLFGYALFNLPNLEHSFREIRSASRLTENNIVCRLYIAAIHLRNYKTDMALSEWLAILKIDPKNPFANRAINVFRKIHQEELSELSKKIYEKKLLPSFTPRWIRKKRKKILLFFCVSTMLILALIPFYPRIINSITNYFAPKNERSAYLQEIAEKDEMIQVSETSLQEILQLPTRETFSKNKLAFLLSDFKKKFVQYRENEALVLANTLFYSNASVEDKTKVYVLQKSIGIPNYISDVSWVSFKEMKMDLWRYNNVTVKWLGTIANIEFVARNDTAFTTQLLAVSDNFDNFERIGKANFLVGFYTKNKEISAIIPIYFLPSIKLQNGDEIELLATLKYNEESNNPFPDLVDTTLRIALQVHGFRYILE